MDDRKSFSHHHRLGLGTLLIAAAVLAGGCVIDSSNCDKRDCPGCDDTGGMAGGGGGSSTPAQDVVLATVDTGATLDALPGDGIGAFIEYAEGGQWHVFTTCDTTSSGLPCAFNIVASVASGASYGSAHGASLEEGDEVFEYSDGVELAALTSNDIDEMTFQAPEGDAVRFEVYLDGQLDARFIYWVGGGAVHNGAPTDPIDLRPNTP